MLYLKHKPNITFPLPQEAPLGTNPGSILYNPRSTIADLHVNTFPLTFINERAKIAADSMPYNNFSLRCVQCSSPHKISLLKKNNI